MYGMHCSVSVSVSVWVWVCEHVGKRKEKNCHCVGKHTRARERERLDRYIKCREREGLTTAGYVIVVPSPTDTVHGAPRPLPEPSGIPAVPPRPLQLPSNHLQHLVPVGVLHAPALALPPTHCRLYVATVTAAIAECIL